jgi:hypothetical protein
MALSPTRNHIFLYIINNLLNKDHRSLGWVNIIINQTSVMLWQSDIIGADISFILIFIFMIVVMHIYEHENLYIYHDCYAPDIFT